MDKDGGTTVCWLSRGALYEECGVQRWTKVLWKPEIFILVGDQLNDHWKQSSTGSRD